MIQNRRFFEIEQSDPLTLKGALTKKITRQLTQNMEMSLTNLNSRNKEDDEDEEGGARRSSLTFANQRQQKRLSSLGSFQSENQSPLRRASQQVASPEFALRNAAGFKRGSESSVAIR